MPGGVIGTSAPFKPGAADGSTNYTHPYVSVIVLISSGHALRATIPATYMSVLNH
jgi:hypothetical protein